MAVYFARPRKLEYNRGMTNKEFFIKTIEAEQPIFIKVIKALPQDKVGFKPHEKARKAGGLAYQLVAQPYFISSIVTTGVCDFGAYKEPEILNIGEMAAMAEKNFTDLKANLKVISDTDWEDGVAKMVWPGGEWATTKHDMAWGFLFDAIHHRGQLSTYLRIMGAKVPSIYGGSADEVPGA